MLIGIDVSHHQGEIDWGKVAKDPQKISFAYIRTGDGWTRDRRVVENLQGAAMHFPVGVYHYFRAERGGKNFGTMHQAVQDSGVRLSLMPMLDIEGAPALRGNPARGAWQDVASDVEADTDMVLKEASMFLDRAKEAYGAAGIYTGRAWLDHVANRSGLDRWASDPLWLAIGANGKVPLPWVTRAPVPGFVLRQYTNQGRVQGIEGRVDMNRCASLDSLRLPPPAPLLPAFSMDPKVAAEIQSISDELQALSVRALGLAHKLKGEK